MATSMSSSQPSGAHGLFWSLLFAVLLLGILTERLLVFLHSCRSSPPPLSAQQERMLKCHAVADVAKAQKEASLLLPVSSPSASTSTSGGQKQKSGKGGQAWLLLFVGAACTLSAAAVALLATAVTGALFYAWNEEHVADYLHLVTHLCIILITLSEAQTAAQFWIILERPSSVGLVLLGALGAQFATGLAGGITAFRGQPHVDSPGNVVVDIYLGITTVLALFLAGMLAAYLRSAPNGPSAHGFTTLARRAMQSGGLKGVMAIGTLGLHVGLSSPVWVGALTVTGVTYACCIIGNLNARHSLRSALQATLTEVSRTEASAGPTWAQVSDLVNAAQRASAPQTPISLYAPKLQLVCSTPEPAQGAGSLPQTPQPSLLHRRRRTSIDLELEEVVTGDETQGHGLGGMPHSPRFLGSLLRRCADPSPRSASFAGDAATSNGGASPSPRNSTFGLSRSRATSMAGHGNAEAISPTNPTHQQDAERCASPTYDTASFTTCEMPSMSHQHSQASRARRQASTRSQKRRSLPYVSNGEGYGSQQSLGRELSMQRRPSAPLPGSTPPSRPQRSPSRNAFNADDTNDENEPAAETQQSSDVETVAGERRRSLL